MQDLGNYRLEPKKKIEEKIDKGKAHCSLQNPCETLASKPKALFLI